MSDWTGTNSTAESIEAGCDLEMPWSDKWRGEKAIQAVKDGKLSREAVERAAANVLYLVERTRGMICPWSLKRGEKNKLEHRELIRRAGTQGITLLKNDDNILPIQPTGTTIAVIGPNANRAIAGGGGSASVNPYYNTLPLDSIKKVAGERVKYSRGCEIFERMPLATPYCTTETGE